VRKKKKGFRFKKRTGASAPGEKKGRTCQKTKKLARGGGRRMEGRKKIWGGGEKKKEDDEIGPKRNHA